MARQIKLFVLGAVLLVLYPPHRLAQDAHAALSASGDPRAAAATSVLIGALSWLLAGWLALLCVADRIALLPGLTGRCGKRMSRWLTPRLIARALGTGIAGGTALSGIAAAPLTVPPAPVAVAMPSQLTGVVGIHDQGCYGPAALPNLDRPVPGLPTQADCPDPASAAPVPAATKGSGTTPPEINPGTYTVRPGDSLWHIAQSELRSDRRDASDGAVAARWPAWWAANRSTLAADPSLLRPGEQLTRPR